MATITLTDHTVEAGDALELNPDVSTTVVVEGSLTVRGRLVARPAHPGVRHRFEFVGGGDDDGLWVLGSGQLDLRGSPKSPWTVTPPVAAGERPDPQQVEGWEAGDRLIVTATAPPSVDLFWQQWEHIGFGDPCELDHPGPFYPEVLNLTRNVEIVGGAGVRIESDTPQAIYYTAIIDAGRTSTPGRYPLHFHRCGDGSRGTVVSGVVVLRGGPHAFVPHASHGITMTHCVAHAVDGSAFWWDPPEGIGDPDPDNDDLNATRDLLWDRCVASATRQNTAQGVTGFELGVVGVNLSSEIRGCVATGGRGILTSGVEWPSSANNKPNVWQASGIVAHNNQGPGIFVWQNDQKIHPITDTLSYHNRQGILHGAYANRYHWSGVRLVDNGPDWDWDRQHRENVGLSLHAASQDAARGEPQTWTGLVIEQTDQPCMWVAGHILGDGTETIIDGGRFSRQDGGRLVIVRDAAGRAPTRLRFDGVEMASPLEQWFWFTADTHPDTVVVLDGLARLYPVGSGREFFAPWNCEVEWLNEVFTVEPVVGSAGSTLSGELTRSLT